MHVRKWVICTCHRSYETVRCNTQRRKKKFPLAKKLQLYINIIKVLMTYYHATTVTSRSSGVMTLQTIDRIKKSLKSFRSMKWHKVKGKVKWWKILSKMALSKDKDNMNEINKSFQHRTIYVFLFYLSKWLIEKIIVTICSIKISI